MEVGMALGAVVVGTNFGCLTHVRALRAAGFEVRALVGRDPDKTTSRAERFAVPVAATNLSEALAATEAEVVVVATPPHTHAPLVLEAIEAGRHVVCEKPFATNADEAGTMLDAAKAAGIVHLLGTEFRWGTGQAMMARLVHEGAIGEPRLATFLLTIPLLADPNGEVPSWWSDAAQGGGWLGAHAAHVVDQIRSTLGEFDGVSAALPQLADRDWTAEDTYVVHFRLQSGCVGTLQSSAADWGPITMMARIAGSQGTVWTEGDVVRVADASGTRTADVPDDLVTPPAEPPPSDLLETAYDLLHATGIDLGPYTRLMETFRDRVLGKPTAPDPVPATFADGVANMAVLDAIRVAAAEQRWVTVGS
jgi:predicted dehydrogenase